MPFGLKSASEVFQKKNKAVFKGIDGIHIAANSVEEHDHILQQVLDRAMECNVILNLDKFQLCISAVNYMYLGSVISHQGMKPDPAKVKEISSMPTPCDKQAVYRLLGMINFVAPHIPNMAIITAPLHDLVKSDVHFQWGPEADNVVRYHNGSSWTPAVVVTQHSTPRSYIIQTANGTLLRRNRRHLRKTVEPKPMPISIMDNDDEHSDIIPNDDGHAGGTELQPSSERRSRFGRVIRPPKRYRDD